MMKQSAAPALLALGLVLSTPLAAQDYPSKPIRLVVPFAPGGPADMLARAIAPTMSATLKQSIIIENKAGAGGAIGVDTVVKSRCRRLHDRPLRDRARWSRCRS